VPNDNVSEVLITAITPAGVRVPVFKCTAQQSLMAVDSYSNQSTLPKFGVL